MRLQNLHQSQQLWRDIETKGVDIEIWHGKVEVVDLVACFNSHMCFHPFFIVGVGVKRQASLYVGYCALPPQI